MDYSIGALATLMQVTVKTLHHYDKIGLLPPASVDERTGYRRYSANQLRNMQLIHNYREMGFTLSQIRTLLDSSTPDENYFEIFESRAFDLARKISRDIEVYRQLCETLGQPVDISQLTATHMPPLDELRLETDLQLHSTGRHDFPYIGQQGLPARLAHWSRAIRSYSQKNLRANLLELRAEASAQNPAWQNSEDYWFWVEAADDPAEGPLRLHFAIAWENEAPPIGATIFTRPEAEWCSSIHAFPPVAWERVLAKSYGELFDYGQVPVGPMFFRASANTECFLTSGLQFSMPLQEAGVTFARYITEEMAEDEDEVGLDDDASGLNPFKHLTERRYG